MALATNDLDLSILFVYVLLFVVVHVVSFALTCQFQVSYIALILLLGVDFIS